MNDAVNWGKENLGKAVDYVKENPATAAGAAVGGAAGFALLAGPGAAAGVAAGAAAGEAYSRNRKDRG